MADAGGLRGGELQRMELVVVAGAQIDRVAVAPAFRQPVDVDEEVEAFLGLVGEELDMAEMRHVETKVRLPAFPLPQSIAPPARLGPRRTSAGV